MARGLFGIFGALNNFFLWFGRQNRTFGQIRQNEEEAARSTRFGGRALCFILIGIPLGVAAIYGGLTLATGSEILPVIVGIFAIVLGGGIIFVMLPYSLTCTVFQLRLNKHPIGFIALLMFFAVIAGAIVLFLYLI